MDSAKLTSDKVELSTIIRDESDGGRVRSPHPLPFVQLVIVPRTEPRNFCGAHADIFKLSVPLETLKAARGCSLMPVQPVCSMPPLAAWAVVLTQGLHTTFCWHAGCVQSVRAQRAAAAAGCCQHRKGKGAG